MINPLEFFGLLLDGKECMTLQTWKKYRVMLDRINNSKIPEID
ncbi:tail fiber assembly protein [Photorhabdus akhurstii]